jgi:hypothetical protein
MDEVGEVLGEKVQSANLMAALRHVWTALYWQGLSLMRCFRLVGAAMCAAC